MSYISKRNNIAFCPNQGFNVLQCGWQKNDPGHFLGPRLYLHYSVTFVLSGCGRYTAGDKTYEVHAGEGFLIIPGVSTYYIADEATPWEYYYAIFQGDDTPALLNAAGIGPDRLVFPFPNEGKMLQNLSDMCTVSGSSAALGYDVLGHFCLCMALLVQQHTKEQNSSTSQAQFIIQAIAFMKANYSYNITIQDVADYVRIERSYLYRLFIHDLGCSPQMWLIQYRLEQSVEMLLTNSATITEIANSVGFFDAPHYCRTFRSKYGQSPSAYRKANRH